MGVIIIIIKGDYLALIELMFKYSMLSINIILFPSLKDDLFVKLIISLILEICIFFLSNSLVTKKKFGCELFKTKL